MPRREVSPSTSPSIQFSSSVFSLIIMIVSPSLNSSSSSLSALQSYNARHRRELRVCKVDKQIDDDHAMRQTEGWVYLRSYCSSYWDRCRQFANRCWPCSWNRWTHWSGPLTRSHCWGSPCRRNRCRNSCPEIRRKPMTWVHANAQGTKCHSNAPLSITHMIIVYGFAAHFATRQRWRSGRR